MIERVARDPMLGDVSSMNNAQLIMRAEQAGMPAQALQRMAQEEALMPSASVEYLRRAIGANVAERAQRDQGLSQELAKVLGLQRSGLKDEAQQAIQNLQQTQTAAPGGIPWKWLLGGAGGMAALNGGLGNMLGLGGAPQQQQRPAPMMTMPMMYL